MAAPAEAEDGAEVMDCSVCGTDLGQMDEYGECSEDGAVFCPACYAKHEETCAECLPLAEDFEDDGRTAIGNGYAAKPVNETKQLSLF